MEDLHKPMGKKTYDIDQIEQKCPIPSPKNHIPQEEDFNSPKKTPNETTNRQINNTPEIITIEDTQHEDDANTTEPP